MLPYFDQDEETAGFIHRPASPQSKATFPVGTLLDGRFEVLRAIKSGGMGSVYEVADQRLAGKTFALKEMINAARGTEALQTARLQFISEVQVMMNLHHPNIPRISTSFMQGNSFCFVMELIPGSDLSQVLKQRGQPGLDPGEVVGWAVQVLDALQHIHALSPPVVHRDIKPANLLLRPDGRLMLVDFGIAAAITADGFWIGTPGYAPPEQQDGLPEPRSDLYALGATMHHLLTGVEPTSFDFQGFAELGVQVEPRLDETIAMALAYYPEERLPSAEEMAQRLRSLSCYSGPLTSGGHEVSFGAAAAQYKSQILDPQLQKLMKTYANECHTSTIPASLDFIQIVLAYMTELELQIVQDSSKGCVRFMEKQGILGARVLGEVDPTAADAAQQTTAILATFTRNYDSLRGF